MGRYSDGLRRLVAHEAARGSFDDARQAVARATGVTIPKRQVEDLARLAARDVEAFYAARRPVRCPADQVLVLQVDGKGIVMRPDSLRPATARAAARDAHRLATRLSPGEKNGRKRMAEIGAVHDLHPVPRTVEDIITATEHRGDQQGEQQGGGPAGRTEGPRASGKWVTASVVHDIPTLVAAVFDEAERRDPQHERAWVALVDGNRQQIDAIQAQANERGVDVTIVIDFVHVLEYLWNAAWTFYFPGDLDAEAWVADLARMVLSSRAVDAAATMRHQADAGLFRGAERKNLDEAVTYLTNKAPHLDYATALTCGWPIATGVIEGACRHLVKDRMDITGARWSLTGAEAILKLRALNTNDHLDEYWPHHQHQELTRNHTEHYKPDTTAA